LIILLVCMCVSDILCIISCQFNICITPFIDSNCYVFIYVLL
jgi:hypothetical protein